MGTRNLTVIKDEESNQEILVMYRQYDGLFETHGRELSEYLAPRKIGNGLPCGEDLTNFSNGMRELAAQIICHFKSQHPHGNIYVYPAGSRDCGEEYIYIVSLKNGEIILEATDYNAATFKGTPQEYLDSFLPDYLEKQGDRT